MDSTGLGALSVRASFEAGQGGLGGAYGRTTARRRRRGVSESIGRLLEVVAYTFSQLRLVLGEDVQG